MRQTRLPPEVEVEAIIGVFLMKALRPDRYVLQVEPWRALIEKPTWRHARALIGKHPDCVCAVIERLVGEPGGFREPAALMCLGKVRQTCGNHEGALDVFVQLADRGGPDCHKATFNVGLCLVSLGRPEEARQTFELVLELVPGDERATRALVGLS